MEDAVWLFFITHEGSVPADFYVGAFDLDDAPPK
jgi:hypothetical protein